MLYVLPLTSLFLFTAVKDLFFVLWLQTQIFSLPSPSACQYNILFWSCLSILLALSNYTLQMFILIFPFMGTLEARLNEQLTPVVQPPPAVAKPSGNTRHSIETLVVVLAVITIVAVIAGIIARLCGGRHFGGNGEHDIEGWVERRCRSCIDGGVPAPPPTPEVPKPAAAEAKPTEEEAKK